MFVLPCTDVQHSTPTVPSDPQNSGWGLSSPEPGSREFRVIHSTNIYYKYLLRAKDCARFCGCRDKSHSPCPQRTHNQKDAKQTIGCSWDSEEEVHDKGRLLG